MSKTIKTTVRFDETDPENAGWYAEYSSVDEHGDWHVVDDSQKVWHPTMPTDPGAQGDAERIAAEYAAELAS